MMKLRTLWNSAAFHPASLVFTRVDVPDDIHLTPGTGEDGMAVSFTIDEPQDNFAPQSILVEGAVTGSGITAASTYDPQGHGLEWVWEIEKQGDAGWTDEEWSAPQRGYPGQYRKGRRYNKRTAIVFDEPGTYDIKLTVIRESDGARATSAVTEYTVADALTFHTSDQIYVIAPDDDFTGAPSPNAGQFTSIDAAILQGNTDAETHALFLLKRGTTTTERFNYSNRNNSIRTITFADWGTGAKPVLNTTLTAFNFLNFTSGLSGGNERQFRASNIRINGTWDGSDGTGSQSGVLVGMGDAWVTVCGVEAYDTGGLGFYPSNESTGGANAVLCIADCVYEGWNGAFVLAGTGKADVAIGCRVGPRENALHMVNSSQNSGYGYRCSGASFLNEMSQCEGFNRLGNDRSGRGFTQEMVRFCTALATPTYIQVDRCWFESTGVKLYARNTGNVQNVTQSVTRSVFISSPDMLNGFIQTWGSGLKVANNLFVGGPHRRPSFQSDVYRLRWFFRTMSATGETGAYANPIIALNNTCLYLGDELNPAISDLAGHTGTYTENQNLIHRPYAPTPVNAGSFDTTKIADPKYTGYTDYIETRVYPHTIVPTHVVELTGTSGTFSEGVPGTEVTLTAPGTVTAKVAQVQASGARLWLYDVTGTISNGATVTLSSGGSGTADGAMREAGVISLWEPTSAPTPDSGTFTRLDIYGNRQTAAYKGAVQA